VSVTFPRKSLLLGYRSAAFLINSFEADMAEEEGRLPRILDPNTLYRAKVDSRNRLSVDSSIKLMSVAFDGRNDKTLKLVKAL